MWTKAAEIIGQSFTQIPEEVLKMMKSTFMKI